MKLKICGMKFSENIQQAAALHPDYLGFIFYKDSPRNYEGIIPNIPSHIKKTGVFVNASLDIILEKVFKYNLRAVQLHGEESEVLCRKLKDALNGESVEIIKVFSIKDEFDFELLKDYEKIVDFFLFDTKGKNKGGNGYSFNWHILKDYPSTTPFFLSGGIGPEEQEKIREFCQHLKNNGKEELLYAIDVNSRFETEPGLKNIELLEKFIDLKFN